MKAGSIIANRFRVERVIARGGMGTVYRAIDEERGEPIALKLLQRPDDLGDERFRREAAVLASLRHPAIVGYIAHGAAEEGAWLAMEWLDGEPLSERLRRELMTPEQAVALARRVAEALGTAHRMGVVHRDIKPSNLFLIDSEPRAAVVLDFGIARRLVRDDDVTEPGSVVGTWSYMAPEQALATAGIDARADVFSLGCVLYECLTGSKAFAAGERTAVLAKILLQDPPRVGELKSNVPLALDDLVARMLSKQPDQRPPDGGAVAEALNQLGDIELLPTRAPSTLPPGLTDREKRVLSIVLAKGIREPDATVVEHGTTPAEEALKSSVSGLGSLHILANGSLLGVVSARGNPVDGAVRAARAALSLQATRPGAAIAVATGFGVVSTRTPVGVVIDRGVETLRQADAGTIRLDATTADLLAERFVLTRGGSSAVLEQERNELDLSRQLLGRASPFLGRSAELATLFATAEQCVEEERAATVLLTGPAGSGKSRLALELCTRLQAQDSSYEISFARADSVGAGSPYQLVTRLVRQTAGIGESEAPAVHRQKIHERLEPWLSDPAELERAVAFVCEVARVGLADDDRPWLAAARADGRLMNDSIKRAFGDWFAAESSHRPLLLILDDLQWGDLPSVALIDSLLERLRNAPFLVLGLARPDVRERLGEPWAARRGTEIALAPLGARTAQRLVRAALGADVDAPTVAHIVSRAEGNAYYLEELIRASALGAGAEVPESVIGMVQTRLDDLDAHARRILRAASVYGERFTTAGLCALLDEELSAPLRAALEDLEQRELVERLSGDEMAFRHSLVREAAYAMLTDSDRRLGHRMAGTFLSSKDGADAWVIAHHFQEAGEPARAAHHYFFAAERALAGNDYAAVLRVVRRALACEPDDALAGSLRLVEARALRWLSRAEDSARSAQEAYGLLPPGSQEWFEAARHAGLGAASLAQFERCCQMIQHATVQKPSVGAESARAICILNCAGAALEGMAHTEVRELLAQVPELEGLAADNPQVGAWWHGTQSLLAHCAGDPVRYAKETERAAQVHDQLGDARMTCLMNMNLGYGLTQLGDFARAEHLLRDAARKARMLGIVRTAVYAEHNLGYTLACAGRHEEALEVEQRAANAAEELEAPTLLAASRAYLTSICLDLGQPEAALKHGRAAVAAADHRSVLPMARAALARALLANGEVSEAVELARAAVDAFEADLALGEDEPYARLALVEALAESGERTQAHAELARARERLLERAQRITDATLREAYLGRIPHHAKTLALYGRWFPSTQQ